MYSIQAHDGAVAAITCSVSYVISIGTDEKLCVWERFQGHLLHTLPAHKAAYSLQLVMLTHHLLITSNQVHTCAHTHTHIHTTGFLMLIGTKSLSKFDLLMF